MLPLTALAEMKVMLGTPCYGASTAHLYSTSLFELAGRAAMNGLPIRLEVNGTSDVFCARNIMVKQFLDQPHLTHLFFVDADIGFIPEQFFRLLLADRDVVAGLYPLKSYNWPDKLPKDMTREEFEHLYIAYPFAPVGNESDEDGFAEVKVATTGFMCIKRHVLEKMVQAYPRVYYHRRPDGEIVGPLNNFFDPVMVNQERLTEDYSFCKMWNDLGGKTFVDCHSKLRHLGQHIFHGDLHGSLEAKTREILSTRAAA